VDWQKKKLYFHQQVFDLKYEKELDYYWPYESQREHKVLHVQLLPNEPEFIKVKDALKLTMPQTNVKTVIKYYFPEYHNFLTSLKRHPQVSYDVMEKLLWSWEFTSLVDKYNVDKNLDKDNPYGMGYQFASSANIAVKLKKKTY
jgi:hypothetical protein